MVMLSSLSLLSLLTFSYAHPTSNLAERAGAPQPQPLPSTCVVSNPLLCTSAAYCPPESRGDPVRPKAATLQSPPNGPLLYGYYLQPDSPIVTGGNDTTLFQKCLETCYGYGYKGDCVGVYQARNYPAPPMYGGAGGNPTVACLLFSRKVGIADFEVVPEGERSQWTDTKVGNIEYSDTC